MKKLKWRLGSGLGVLILMQAFQMVLAQSYDIPVPALGRNGNCVTSFPFFSLSPVRYQQVYSAKEYSINWPHSGIITGIFFSYSESTSCRGFGTISNLQVS